MFNFKLTDQRNILNNPHHHHHQSAKAWPSISFIFHIKTRMASEIIHKQ